MNLDVRQRAMLRAMGVRVWQPMAGIAQTSSAPESIASEEGRSGVKDESGHQSKSDKAFTNLPNTPNSDMPARPHAGQGAAPARAASPPPMSATSATGLAVSVPAEPATASGAPECWQLGQAQALFADTAQAGGPRWLVLAQLPPAALDAPAFDGDAGLLLANMLRAARLHQGAGAVVFAPLVRQAISGSMDAFSAALSALLGQARPDIVLVMGRLAAQALLDSSEAFGKLRGRPHDLQGCTTVVTYDAPYLLRCPLDKARAWDDLCLAMSLAAAQAARSA